MIQSAPITTPPDFRFDPTLGYPTSVAIDHDRRSSDGGISFQLSGVTPIAP